jgi:hypothetical protein
MARRFDDTPACGMLALINLHDLSLQSHVRFIPDQTEFKTFTAPPQRRRMPDAEQSTEAPAREVIGGYTGR